MKTIKFLRDREVKDAHAGTKKATHYTKDQVIELPDSSADHWINRGVAVEVTAEEMRGSKPTKTEPAAKP